MEKVRRGDLIFPELSYAIVGCCFDVHNQVGGGKSEAVYQRALAIRLSGHEIPFEEQVRVPIICDGTEIGSDIADFLVARSIVVELKAGNRTRRQDFGQVRRYVSALGVPLGILARFTPDGIVTSRVLSPANAH